MPTNTEKNAINLANQLNHLITDGLQKYKIHLTKLNGLSDKILSLLDTVPEKELYNSRYYAYLLQQISRYNAFFQTVQITDTRSNTNSLCSATKINLAQYKAQPISHKSITQLMPVKLRVSVIDSNDANKKPYFRDAYTDNNGVSTEYHYDKKQTPQGTEHQNKTHYKKANAAIFFDTQTSNCASLFKQLTYKIASSLNTTAGQRTDDYFKLSDKDAHEHEKTLFKTAQAKIRQGDSLNDTDKKQLAGGQYYRQPNVTPAPDQNKSIEITHIGHATELLRFTQAKAKPPFVLHTDPVHYQTATTNVFEKIGGQLLYPRQTSPALLTDGYPGVNVVILSHNHHDHMCRKTLEKIYDGTQTLFIVPVGDGKLLRDWGFKNIIELSSWNQAVNIDVLDYATGQKNTSYRIQATPAKHASGRGISDAFQALYMGFLIYEENTEHSVLITGDTAVLDQVHYDQLSQYLIDHKLMISATCIAHGPDRPRNWMRCTHQSSAEAITLQARFNVMNAKCLANNTSITKREFIQYSTTSIAYHQGCYRLGLLSYRDVETTVLRTLAVLSSFDNTPAAAITKTMLKNNFYYNIMDTFERKALQETLQVYASAPLKTPLTATDIKTLIEANFWLPMPGYQVKATDRNGFVFDYSRLIVNKNTRLDSCPDIKGAFEDFACMINPQHLNSIKDNLKNLTTTILSTYVKKPTHTIMDAEKVKLVNGFLQTLKDITEMKQLRAALLKLYIQVEGNNGQPPDHSETLRDEGHFQTAMLILFGLMDFPTFKASIITAQQLMTTSTTTTEYNPAKKTGL